MPKVEATPTPPLEPETLMATAPAAELAPPPSKGRLLRVLGVAFGLAVIVGNTIGVGILRTPGDVAAQLPQPTWFLGIWIAGGVYALLGALTLAELGAMIPQSGGQYVFARRALGEYAGFVIGWTDWISSCASEAAVTIALAEYLGVLFPALQPGAALVASGVVVGFAVIQWRGVRSGDITQQITSLLKTVVLLGLAGVCLFAAPSPEGRSLLTAPVVLPTFGALILALQSVIYTYDGWNGMLYFGGEVKNPGRDIPRSMAGGVLAVIVIYLLLNLAFLHVLPLSRMAGENLVAATAAQAIFGPRGDSVVRSILVVCILSAANAILMIASRVPFAMSRDRLLPSAIGSVNRGGTPTMALMASAGLSVLLIVSGTFAEVLALAAFYFVLQYTLSFISVLVLRRAEPETPRPYRAWGYPYITWLLVLGSIGFLVGNVVSDRRNSLWSMGLLAVSYPVFRLSRRPRS